MALDSFPSLAWPLLHAQLAAAQEAFLAGDCYARPEPGAAAAALAAAGGAPVAAAQPLVLSERFAAAVARGDVVAAGGATDAAVRLTHLLKAMAAANNNTVESKSRDWVQLFLAFTDANAGGSEEDGGDAAAPAADEEAVRGSGRHAVRLSRANSTPAARPGHLPQNVRRRRNWLLSAPRRLQESEEEAEEEKEGAGGERRGVVASGVVSGRAWRSGLREWLALLGGLKGARGMYQWEAVQVWRGWAGAWRLCWEWKRGLYGWGGVLP